MRRGALGAATLTMLAVAVDASAGGERNVVLAPGQGFTVTGTKIVCVYGGKAGVPCGTQIYR